MKVSFKWFNSIFKRNLKPKIKLDKTLLLELILQQFFNYDYNRHAYDNEEFRNQIDLFLGEELGFRPTEEPKPDFELDLIKHLGINNDQLKHMPTASDRMDNDADIVLQQLIEETNSHLNLINEECYENDDYKVPDRASPNFVVIDKRNAFERVTKFIFYKDTPLVLWLNHRDLWGGFWELYAQGEKSAEFMLMWHKKTEEFFVKKNKGKVLGARINNIKLKTYSFDELIYSPVIQKKINDLCLQFQSWLDQECSISRWGCLLVGPPGTGKTTIAGLLASHKNENCTILYSSASDFKAENKSESTELITKLFKNAELLSPTFLIIDDVDELSVARWDESESTTAAMLRYLDDLIDTGNVFVLLTTNRPNVMDPAVKRAGRVHNIIRLGSYKECFTKLLYLYAQKYSLILPSSIEDIVRDRSIPDEITPDEVHNIVKRLVLQNQSDEVSELDIEKAIDSTIEAFYEVSQEESL